jgi:hypothetical protein
LKIGITKKERDIMSKNLTRKGLALGAVVALGATVFAGSPAFAANEINVAPAAGTSYNAVAGSVFNLATTFAPGFTPSSYAQLKYIVTSDANSAIHYGSATSAVTAPGTAQAVSLSSAAVTAASASAVTVNYLGLKADDATVTSSVSVTAFVDANNDGAVSAGEWNTVKTVTFKKLADITPVVTLTQPSTGDATVSATVAWGDLNSQQAGVGVVATGSTNSALGVEFKLNSGSFAAATAYNSTTGAFTKSQSIADSDVVTAQAVWATNTYVSTPTNTYSSAVVGSAVSGTASVRGVSSLTGAVVAGNDATAAGVVRTNGSFTAKVTALNTATTPVAAASVAVVATVATSATLVAASTGVTEKSITVNGVKYTTNAALTAASVALTTDASGVATVAVSSTGLVATNTITVSFAAQNRTGSAVATETDAAYTVSDDAASTVIATNKNTATTLNYSVKDQFGVLSALTNGRLVVTATQSGGTIADQYIAISGGKASFSIAPATDIVTPITVHAVRQVSTNTNGTITWAADGTNVADRTINIRTAAYAFTVAPAIDATNGINNGAWTTVGAQKQTLTTVDQSNTAATGYVAPAASTTWAKVTLTGSNAGEKLTVSGTGVFLSIDGAAVAKDSASKVAQAAAAVIYVASNTTGAKTLTVSNGSVSATVVVTFDKAGSTAGAKVALGDLAALSQAGRSVDVSAVITDVFGNPVQGATVTLSATGVGYLANNGTTTSDASGKVTAKLIVGAAETGDAVVTASSTLADATVATASKTVTFGSTDANVDIVNNRVTAVATFAKGKTVSFYVDGIKKWSKASTSDADVVINYNLKKGTHTVAVKISGGFSAVEKFIVK